MKTFISFMFLMCGLLMLSPSINQVKASNLKDQRAFMIDQSILAPVVSPQEEGGVEPAKSTIEEPAPASDEGGNFFSDNWGTLLMGLLGFFDLVARLTPTEKDNSIVNFLASFFNTLIPNLKKGGGSFQLLSK